MIKKSCITIFDRKKLVIKKRYKEKNKSKYILSRIIVNNGDL